MPELTQKRLKELLDYDPKTGVFRWRTNRPSRFVGGRVAGWVGGRGYRYITIERRHWLAHRLAWLYVRGLWPTEEIDHINGQRDDNRLINLREATARQNARNQGLSKNNATGFKGVSWDRDAGRFRAYIYVDRKRIYLGLFSSLYEAANARARAEHDIFCAFARGATQ